MWMLIGAAGVRRKSTTAEEGRDPDPAAAVSKAGPGKKRQAKKPAGAPAAQRMRIQVSEVHFIYLSICVCMYE